MEAERTSKKKKIIVGIYFAILLIFCLFVYSWLKPVPSCFDGKKNQNEEEIDCGGICEKKCEIVVEDKLQVLKTGFVNNGSLDKYDLYGLIKNPNNFFGSSSFNYKFIIKEASGNIIATREGEGFILPGEEKYLVENNLEIKEIPISAELEITGTKWVEFKDFFEKPQLKVINKSYNEISSGVGFSEAKGLLKNESLFDFSKIKIKIILKDEKGTIIALNSTEMNTVKSDENRDFRVFWPNRFSGNVLIVEVQPEVNVFNSESFIKKYFKTEKFQEY